MRARLRLLKGGRRRARLAPGLEVVPAPVLTAEPEALPPVVDTAREACWICEGTKLWESIYGAVTCGLCHPPADVRLVRRWLTARPRRAWWRGMRRVAPEKEEGDGEREG